MSLSDWESELTDLESSSDEEYVPTRKRGRPPAKVEEYTIKDHLKPPRATNYSTKHIYELLVSGNIDLDPQYQRDVVWPETKQAGLIDSLMRNYYVPPVIFAVKRDPETGEDVRVCIDGKQRLTSLRRFIDGEIAHRDSITGKKYFYKQPGGPKRLTLSSQLIRTFQLKQMVCMEYNDIDEEQEREIFQRVQLGMALTVAERMQAVSGPWPDLIREIQSATIGEEGFGDALEWGSGRGRDFQCLTTIVYLITDKVILPAAQQLDKWLSRAEPVPLKLRSDVLETFRIFVHLAREPKHSRCFQKPTRISPIEFVMTGYAIYALRKKLSFAQLSSAIAKMREDVRVKHVDIRANKKVLTTMHNFLQNVSKNSSVLGKDTADSISASEAIKTVVPVAYKPTKRKRAEAQMDDDDDDDVEPPRRPAPVKATTLKAAMTTKTKTKVTATKVTKSVTPKENGTRTTVKKVSASAPATKAPAPASVSRASVATRASPSASKTSRAISSATPRTSSSSTTPQQSSKPNASPDMGPPAVPQKTHTQDSMDVDLPSRAESSCTRRASTERLLPSLTRAAPLVDPTQLSAAPSAQTRPAPTPPTAPRAMRETPSGSPPVVIKPDPDSERSRSVLDRLAPIRNAKSSAPNSPAVTSPTQSLFAQHQQQFLQQHIGASTSASPHGSEQDRPLLLPRTPVDPTFQHNGPTQSPASPTPQITAATVQSLLARARYQPSPASATAAGAPAANVSTQNADVPRDPRRRLSMTPAQSPNQPFTTPSFVNGGAGQLSQSQPSQSPPVAQVQLPTQPAQPTLPMLPKRPDVVLKVELPGDPMIATRMAPEQRVREPPRGPRWDP